MSRLWLWLDGTIRGIVRRRVNWEPETTRRAPVSPRQQRKQRRAAMRLKTNKNKKIAKCLFRVMSPKWIQGYYALMRLDTTAEEKILHLTWKAMPRPYLLYGIFFLVFDFGVR